MKIRIFKLWFRFFLFRLENNHKLIIKNHCILNQVVKHLIKSVHHQFLNMNWVIYEKSNTYISSFNIWSHSFSTPVAVWRAAYCKRFPQEVSRKKKNVSLILIWLFLQKVEKRDPSLMQDYGRDPAYADASIDAMREQKLAVNEFIIKNHLVLCFFFLLRNYNVF